jgi:hypothetical protein
MNSPFIINMMFKKYSEEVTKKNNEYIPNEEFAEVDKKSKWIEQYEKYEEVKENYFNNNNLVNTFMNTIVDYFR